MFILLSTILFILPIFTSAANDWSTPCAGSCAYETGDGETTAWGSILLDGASEAISDISTAAGWSIMDCNSTSQDTQAVRLVCHDPDAGCDHLFQGGAVDTIVRLPDECAGAPFARVVNVTTSTNQTLTPDVAQRVATRRRRSSPPEVMTVTIDYNFQLLPPSRGTISLTALATTNPLQRPLASSQNLRRALGYGENGSLNARSGNSPSELVAREIRRRDLFADFIAGNQIPPEATADTATSSNSSDTGNRLMFSEKWTKDWNKQFNVLNIQDSYNVLDMDLACSQNGDIPAFHAKAKIDAAVNIQATVTVGFIVSGSILPPAITQAAFTSALGGGAQVAFNISTVAQGSFDTGLIPFYSSGMAGLSIPGILDVGPTFSINGQGTGNISVCTDAIVTANYQFPNVSMVFPQDQGPSNGQASQGDDSNPLSLSIGGSTTLSGSFSAHLIPRIDLGVKVLSGMASAGVFLELDGYGAMDMSLSLDEPSSTTALPSSTEAPITQQAAIASIPSSNSTALTIPDTSSSPSTDPPTSTPAPTSDTSASSDSSTTSLPPAADDLALPPVAVHELSQDPSPTPAAHYRPEHRQQQQQNKRDVNLYDPRDDSDLYSGCVGMNMGVKIVAGAQGKLFSFWHDSTSFDLFSQDWQLLNKCFKGQTRRSLPYRHGPIVPSSRPPSVQRRDLISSLVCPLIENALADAITADNQIV